MQNLFIYFFIAFTFLNHSFLILAKKPKIKRSTGWIWDEKNSKNDSEKKPEEITDRLPKSSDDTESRGYFVFDPTTTAAPSTSTSPNCTCVPYYYCDEGQVVGDERGGIIDIRSGWPCPSILQVCCRAPIRPSSTTTSRPIVSSTAIPGYTPRCGNYNPNGVNARILGFKESETQFGEFPWMSAVLELKKIQGKIVNQFVCGGTLIWPSVVLTAQHCVIGKKEGHLTVRLGEWDTQTTNEFYPHQDIKVREIVGHPNYYGGGLYNDVALLFLERPAVLSPHIDTACMPIQDRHWFDNLTCRASGWGKNAFGQSGSYQAILKEVELPIVSNSVCQEALRKTNLGAGFNLHENFLCAGGLKGQDTCVGDGGGPLVCASTHDPWRYVVAGIVAWGVGCGNYGVPGVYMDVSKIRNWIDTTIHSKVPGYDRNKASVTPIIGNNPNYG